MYSTVGQSPRWIHLGEVDKRSDQADQLTRQLGARPRALALTKVLLNLFLTRRRSQVDVE